MAKIGPFFCRRVFICISNERESNSRLLPYPTGRPRPRPRGPVPFAVHSERDRPPFFVGAFSFPSLTVRAQRSAGRRPLRPGSLRSCSAGSLIHVHVHVPRTGSLRPRSLGVRRVHLSAYTCREQSSAPSSCLISLPSAQFTRPARQVHSSALGLDHLAFGRFTHRPSAPSSSLLIGPVHSAGSLIGPK